MSFRVSTNLRSTVNFQRIIDDVERKKQVALRAAENAGFEYLRNETPVLSGDLVSSAESHENQYSVWFTIAGILAGRPYGFAQEFGWHQHGNFYPGHHMLEGAAEVAYEAFVLAFGGNVSALSSGLVTRDIISVSGGPSGMGLAF